MGWAVVGRWVPVERGKEWGVEKVWRKRNHLARPRGDLRENQLISSSSVSIHHAASICSRHWLAKFSNKPWRNLRPEHGCPKQHARERTSSLQQCFNATTPHAPAPPSGSQQLFPYWQDCPSLGGAAEPQAVTSTGSSTSSANFQKDNLEFLESGIPSQGPGKHSVPVTAAQPESEPESARLRLRPPDDRLGLLLVLTPRLS
eukprot:2762784-Rhodomonas_salina.1